MKMDNKTMLLIAKRNDQNTSHILHLILSVITVGLWVPVWMLVAVSHGIERRRIDAQIAKAGG
jgi:Na+-transporting NADH:ubiquinone oxidoreductase subunit NqrC